MSKSTIIIIGGGFAGVQCGRSLRRKLSVEECEIVVFNRENHMVFHPLLAEVAAAAISPKDMAAPLRELLKNVRCRTEEVTDIDLANNRVVYAAADGSTHEMPYDHLVISGGSTTNLAFIPGMADHAFAFKNASDALAIQAHVIGKLEDAEVAETEEYKKRCLSFVIVGGGFSGVELAGELNDLVRSSCRYYSNFKEKDVSVTLIHSHDQILPEVSSTLREFARKKMEKNGIKFVLNATAKICTHESVGLADGSTIHGGTIICTIGSRPLPMIENLKLPKTKGRLTVNADMSVPGYQNVWAIGDCAAVLNAVDNQLSPTTGQFAERQGAQVAANILRHIKGEKTKPFSHHSLGTLCSIGGKSAVAEMFNLRISGFLAWVVWRGVYLIKLPSIGQKIKVGVGWAFDLVLPPQLSAVRVDSSQRIGNAHYAAGDMIFKAGDPATDFYVIKEGMVEIVKTQDGKEEAIAVLGVGDFFGESSLLNHKLHKHSCRALSNCEIMIMGKNIFNSISESLIPLRDSLAHAMQRRRLLFQNFPEAEKVVQSFALKDLMEPLKSPAGSREQPLTEVVKTINSDRLDCAYIVDENKRLSGMVTKADLIRWADTVATNQNQSTISSLKAGDLMVPVVFTVSEEDQTVFAISMLREHGLNSLPVVSKSSGELLGVLRVENLMEQVLGRVCLIEQESTASLQTV